ncbi:MAG: hypothetical protein MMC33_005461 [Icmadophila ericetorum]|nr:hypothetical protein [Icmadophila ericetorum]
MPISLTIAGPPPPQMAISYKFQPPGLQATSATPSAVFLYPSLSFGKLAIDLFNSALWSIFMMVFGIAILLLMLDSILYTANLFNTFLGYLLGTIHEIPRGWENVNTEKAWRKRRRCLRFVSKPQGMFMAIVRFVHWISRSLKTNCHEATLSFFVTWHLFAERSNRERDGHGEDVAENSSAATQAETSGLYTRAEAHANFWRWVQTALLLAIFDATYAQIRQESRGLRERISLLEDGLLTDNDTISNTADDNHEAVKSLDEWDDEDLKSVTVVLRDEPENGEAAASPSTTSSRTQSQVSEHEDSQEHLFFSATREDQIVPRAPSELEANIRQGTIVETASVWQPTPSRTPSPQPTVTGHESTESLVAELDTSSGSASVRDEGDKTGKGDGEEVPDWQGGEQDKDQFQSEQDLFSTSVVPRVLFPPPPPPPTPPPPAGDTQRLIDQIQALVHGKKGVLAKKPAPVKKPATLGDPLQVEAGSGPPPDPVTSAQNHHVLAIYDIFPRTCIE